MRLTKRFLAHSFILVVFLLFTLPALVYYLDSADRKESDHRMKQEKREKLIVRGHDVIKENSKDEIKVEHVQPPPVIVGGAGANVVHMAEKVVDPPFKEESTEPDLGPKSFGPKAEFTKGEFGNYEPVIHTRSGPGEGGLPVLTTMEEKDKADQTIRDFGFNMIASDKIAMNRTIPDMRMSECKYWRYPQVLPTASVIIVFHNEGFSTLMRTVHSVIDASPPQFLHEVVMVDDFSDKEHLKSRLDDYIIQFHGKVKLYRNTERLGLIGTRTMGARYATGDVIVFLDAHCECAPNWLPPLLSRIAYDRTIMAVPIIDGIDWNTFKYSPVYGRGEHFRGIFEWGFLYKESRVPDVVLRKREHDSEPYHAPTHAGGLFAMDRKYFFELGAYDPGLQIWGGENFELSFKIWQCGGSIEWVPCSRVGHVYRNHMPYGFGKISSKIPIILLNYMRVVEVWLDPEHREYFYTREPTIRGYPIGDISKQLEFKQQHRCRSFKWFLENVAMEVLEKFPAPSPNIAWGEIQLRSESICWDTKGQQPNGGPIGAYHCHHYGGNQMFRLNAEGQLATGERCIDPLGDSEIHVIYCPVSPTGRWQYANVTGHIVDRTTRRCATVDVPRGHLSLATCDENNKMQQFNISPIPRSW